MSETFSEDSLVPDPAEQGEQRLGRYTIVEQLARGGMAQLYVVRKDGDFELRALKRILESFREHDLVVKRFHREAWVSSLLDHPNVVRTYDAGFEDGIFCLVTELIPGKNVASMLEAERARGGGPGLPVPVAAAIALATLEALAYAHDLRGPDGAPLGIVHRDITPRNILVGFAGEVKVIDFGVVRGNIGGFRTAPGVIVGSLEYLSPEQAIGEAVDRRSDLYSVGAVLYEMLTGRGVIGGTDKLADMLQAIVRETAPPPSRVNPAVPEAFDPVLNMALAKAPADRFQTALDMRNALVRALGTAQIEPATRVSLGNLLEKLLPDDKRWFHELIENNRRFALMSPEADDVSMPTSVPTLVAARFETTEIVPRPGRMRPVVSGATLVRAEPQEMTIREGDVPEGATEQRPLPRTTSSARKAPLEIGTQIRVRPVPLAATMPSEHTKIGAPALEMPGEAVLTATGLVPRKVRQLQRMLAAVVVVAMVLLGAVVYNMMSDGAAPVAAPAVETPGVQQRPAPPSAVSDRKPEPEPKPELAAPEEAPAAAPALTTQRARPERRVEPRRAKPAPVEPAEAPEPKEPPPPPEPERKVAAPYPELRALLRELRATTSRDNKRYVQLLEGIAKEAKDLPAPTKRAIDSELGRAELTYDVEVLARALQVLIKSKSG